MFSKGGQDSYFGACMVHLVRECKNGMPFTNRKGIVFRCRDCLKHQDVHGGYGVPDNLIGRSDLEYDSRILDFLYQVENEDVEPLGVRLVTLRSGYTSGILDVEDREGPVGRYPRHRHRRGRAGGFPLACGWT